MWTTEQLKEAVLRCDSFRAVSKALGSPGSKHKVKMQADEMKLDYSHFKAYRTEIGKKYAKLVVISTEFSNKKTFATCRCECGAETKARLDSIRAGHTKSCGAPKCAFQDRDYWGSKNPAFRGCGGLPGGKVWELELGAKKRGLTWAVTKEYLWQLYEDQGQKCALTGVSIIFGHKGVDTTASLDRIDSTRGYEEGNLQWVHRLVNQMKWSITQERFIEICYLVTERNHRPSQVVLTVEHSRLVR